MLFNETSSTQKHNARRMRKSHTDAERKLWYLLKDRRLSGYKFRRQVPIGVYIVDFLCVSQKLIIEADGSQHVENKKDLTSDNWLEQNGFRILRFWNNDIFFNQNSVLEMVWHHLNAPHPPLRGTLSHREREE